MQGIVRSVIAVLIGSLLAAGLVAASDAFLRTVYPFPSGLAASDAEGMRNAIAALPPAAFVIALVTWILAAAAGAYVASRIAKREQVWHGVAVALLLTAATAANLAMFPHPVWMWIAIALLPLAGWTTARMGAPRPSAA